MRPPPAGLTVMVCGRAHTGLIVLVVLLIHRGVFSRSRHAGVADEACTSTKDEAREEEFGQEEQCAFAFSCAGASDCHADS